MKNKYKLIICLSIMIFMFAFVNVMFAADAPQDTSNTFWQKASEWFGKVDKTDYSESAVKIINQFVEMVNIIGTTVIVIATIFLGIKYMFGSVNSKADVKESMVTLLIACVFFFGWSSISNVILNGNQLFLTSTADESYKNIVGRIFNIAVYISQILAIIAVIYVGVRYVFAGSNGKAELKGKSVYFIIGIILTFSASTFLSVLSNVINEMIQ